MGKHKFTRANKAKKASDRKRKGKAKKKGSSDNDWYTSDTLMGMFAAKKDKSGSNKRVRQEDKSRMYDAAGQMEYDEEDERDLANANAAPRFVSDSEAESDEGESSEGEDPFNQLLAGLDNSTGLDDKHRSVLNRMRRQQEGHEEDSSEDELEEEDDDDDAEDGDHSDASEEHRTGESEDENESEDGTSRGKLGGNDAEDEATGTQFSERFVAAYGMNEDDLETLVQDTSELVRDRKKISLSNASSFSDADSPSAAKPEFLLTSVGYKGNVVPSKFSPASVNADSPEKAADVLELKLRLATRWLQYASRRDKICLRRLGPQNVPARNEAGFTSLQNALSDQFRSYSDVVFSARSLANASELRELYVLHALNHVIKANDLTAKHTARIRVRKELSRKRREERLTAKALGNSDEGAKDEEMEDVDEDISELIRDQGFSRAKVLILVPTRLAALRVVRMLLALLPENAAVLNKTKFWGEFSEEETDGKEAKFEKKRIKRERMSAEECYDELYLAAGKHPSFEDDLERSKGASTRAADWHEVFNGNNDECFRFGVAINGRKSVRLFSDFYRSDIIIASPVGLRMATNQKVGDGAESSEESDMEEQDFANNGDGALAELGVNIKDEKDQSVKRKRGEDTDFLSSIEMCIVDQAELLETQNFQHLVDVMAALNRKPTQMREEIDFSRVRPYHLIDGLARRFRQTLVFSQYTTPYLNSLVMPKSASRLNLAGFVSWRPARHRGVLEDIDVNELSHKFVNLQHVEVDAAPQFDDSEDEDEPDEDDKRLAYFEKKVLKTLKRSPVAHTLVLVPSFLEFVSVRAAFRRAAFDLGEAGVRARGKPCEGMSKKRKRDRNGKLVKPPQPTQALFTAVSEYSNPRTVARARSDLQTARARVLLTTERFFLYHRYRLRGIRRVVFFNPPSHATFYSELANLIEASEPETSFSRGVNDKSRKPSVLTLFDSSDCIALERIVGTTNTRAMLKSETSVFEFAPNN